MSIRSMATKLPAASSRTSATDRPISVRLDDDRLQDLDALAELDATSAAEQIRLACAAFINSRLEDPGLPALIDAAVMRFRDSIDLLGPPQPARESARVAPRRNTETEKSVTIRLGVEQADYLTSLSILDDFTIADEIRAAVDAYLDARRSDPALKDLIDRNQARHDMLIAHLRVSRSRKAG